MIMDKLNIDVMTMGGAKFYCSMEYPYNPLFKVELEDILRYVYEKRPLLKYEKDVKIFIDKNRQEKNVCRLNQNSGISTQRTGRRSGQRYYREQRTDANSAV